MVSRGFLTHLPMVNLALKIKCEVPTAGGIELVGRLCMNEHSLRWCSRYGGTNPRSNGKAGCRGAGCCRRRWPWSPLVGGMVGQVPAETESISGSQAVGVGPYKCSDECAKTS